MKKRILAITLSISLIAGGILVYSYVSNNNKAKICTEEGTSPHPIGMEEGTSPHPIG